MTFLMASHWVCRGLGRAPVLLTKQRMWSEWLRGLAPNLRPKGGVQNGPELMGLTEWKGEKQAGVKVCVSTFRSFLPSSMEPRLGGASQLGAAMAPHHPSYSFVPLLFSFLLCF